jgi:hypothetical protein
VASTRVGGSEDAGVGQIEEGQEDTWKKARGYHAMVERYLSQGGRSAVAPEDVGDNPDKAHDDQTPVGCGGEDEAGGVVAVVGVAVVVGDEVTVVVVVAAAAAVAYA